MSRWASTFSGGATRKKVLDTPRDVPVQPVCQFFEAFVNLQLACQRLTQIFFFARFMHGWPGQQGLGFDLQ